MIFRLPTLRLLIFFLLAFGVSQSQTRFAVDDFAGHSSTVLRPDVTSSANCDTTGVQNIAVLTVTTPANPTLPAAWSSSAIQQAYFATSGLSLNTYWQEASYGQTSATGQVIAVHLTSNYDCSDLDSLASAAISASNSSYNRFAIIFPATSCSTPDLGSIAGYGSIGCYVPQPLNRSVSVAWIPIFSNTATPANSIGVLAHEHGHNLGLNHSSSEAFTNMPLGAPDTSGTISEYGDAYSVMGNADINSTNPTIGQYTGQHKALELNWLAQTEVMSGGTYTLSPFESSSGTRALRILRDPVAGSWLWAEYRQPQGVVDSTLSHLSSSNVFSGMLIHYENPNLDNLHTYLLNFAGNAALTSGQTWQDPYSPLTLTANSANSVTASYATNCAALALNSASITVTAPSTCSWTASTASAWITLSGRTSGTGNGTISFSQSANSNLGQRLGFITVNRQSLAVIQAGTGISITGVTPAVTSGTTGQVAIQLTDPAGIGDIVAVYVTFSGPESCVVSAYPGTKSFALTNDAGNGSVGSTTTGTLSNKVCSLFGSQSSVTGQGTQLTVTLAMNFPIATFSGSHHITILGQNQAGLTSELTIGTWTVGAAALTAISPGSATAGTGAFTVTANGTNFTSGETIAWNGGALATTFVSATQLTATVPASLIASAGTATVTVSGATGSQTFTINAAVPVPVITTGGVVPVGSATPIVSPGSWISIYGANFSTGTYQWAGEYPTSLGGVSVTIDGLAAFLSYVGPGQINAQVPNDSRQGSVPVIVTTATGTQATSTVTLAAIAPSWIPYYPTNYAVSVIPTSATTYTVGTKAQPLAPGTVIELFGVGFGPTVISVPAGQAFSGMDNTSNPVSVTVGGVNAQVYFAGLILGGLYQINIVIPQVAAGDQALVATINGVQTPSGVYLPIGN